MRRRRLAVPRDRVVMARGRRQAAAKAPGERIDQTGKVERGVEIPGGEKSQGPFAHARLTELSGGASAAFAACNSLCSLSASARYIRAARRCLPWPNQVATPP